MQKAIIQFEQQLIFFKGKPRTQLFCFLYTNWKTRNTKHRPCRVKTFLMPKLILRISASWFESRWSQANRIKKKSSRSNSLSDRIENNERKNQCMCHKCISKICVFSKVRKTNLQEQKKSTSEHHDTNNKVNHGHKNAPKAWVEPNLKHFLNNAEALKGILVL